MELCTNLQWALISGHLYRVKLYLTDEFPENEIEKLGTCREIINFLLEQKKNCNILSTNYSTLLHFAIINHDHESFYLLLEDSEININAIFPKTKTTLLHLVAMRGTYEMAETLLKRGANANAVGNFNVMPLHFACGDYYISFSTSSIQTRKINTLKDPKIVQLLLEQGCNPDTESFIRKENPLLLSCQFGYLEIFKILLQNGANLNVVNRDGQNVLHMAAMSGHPDLIKIILDKGFDPNCKDYRGRTPVFEFKSNGLPKALDLLIKYGADVNSQDYSRNTPLHFIYFFSSLNFERFLKSYPDINVCNKCGETPLDAALQFRDLYNPDGHESVMTELFEILCKYIAKLKAADKFISERNLYLMKNDRRIKRRFEIFELELNRMKEEKISSSSSVCYFSILTTSLQKLTVLFRNDEIMKSLSSEKYKEMFPLYAGYITEFINEAIIRRDFIETCASRLCKHVEQNLSHLITDQIFSYLSEEDLQNFEEAFINVRK